MVKITTRQLLEAEKSGRKLTKEEQAALTAFQKAVKHLNIALSERVKEFNDIICQLMAQVRITGKLIDIQGSKPVVKFEGLVHKEKGLNLKDEAKDFVYNYLLAKCGDLTISELLNLPPSVIEKYFFEWVNEIESNAKKQLRNNNIEYTHRHYAIAENYKTELGEAERLRPEEIENKYGAKRKQAFYSINPKSEAYKPIKISELERAIELLQNNPLSLNRALSDLERLKKS